ncbi:hypothetical protein AVEN_259391-1 [Araneus ventricosus]|uniref:Uncharacterized protein n=1 Tax=Araneus ventricosus TaxID=182803 RepID=A0A4Y2DTZ1_ARAVE|nr:hypothetical protein AVEN_259391-1 [Araneus ventricosus]
MLVKGLLRESSLLLVRSFDRRALSNDFEGIETEPVEPVVNVLVSLDHIMGQEVDMNDINDLVEKNNQDLITEELMQLHSFPERSCGGEFVREREDNSKATIFWHNKRNAESMGNCCIIQ